MYDDSGGSALCRCARCAVDLGVANPALALDSMCRRDFDSGVLEQTLVGAQVPFVAVLIRIFMQWLSTGFIRRSGWCAAWFNARFVVPSLPATALSLLGTPALSLLGSIGASVMQGLTVAGLFWRCWCCHYFCLRWFLVRIW